MLTSFFMNRSCLDENEAFLTTADSAIKLLPEATRRVTGWKGLEYRAAFPMLKPPGANFYPPDMDKMEFQLWKDSLTKDKEDATGFFNVIKRHSEFVLESSLSKDSDDVTNHSVDSTHDLYIVPFSQEYNPFLKKAAELLHKAGDLTSSSSLKRLLHSKANAFLSNDYYESDIAWMELNRFGSPGLLARLLWEALSRGDLEMYSSLFDVVHLDGKESLKFLGG
uniref:Uncharacterized protein n=1 Tax=Fagus sylvatica TaxID=28930 RepID=A0A2N9IH20_FAGSY